MDDDDVPPHVAFDAASSKWDKCRAAGEMPVDR